LFAAGMAGMSQAPDKSLSLIFNGISVEAGTAVSIIDESGNTVYTAEGIKQANQIVFASADLKDGSIYKLYLNGSQAASAVAAVGAGGGFPGGQGGFPGQGGSHGGQGWQPGQGGNPGSQGQQPGQGGNPGSQGQQPGQGENPGIPGQQDPAQGEPGEGMDNPPEKPSDEPGQNTDRPEDLVKPAVTGLKAEAAGVGTVALHWDKCEGAQGYIILRNGKQTGYTATADYLDTSADADDFNYYWVIPFSKQDGVLLLGEIGDYAWAFGRTVGAVGKVTALSGTKGVSLSWDAADGADAYVVLSRSGSASAPFNETIVTSDTGCTIDCDPGVYFFWVYGIYMKDGKTLAAGKVSPYTWAVVK
ncbi:MAG: hypothetical protein IKN57_10330, partial [Parasporobacterium sp.]|nr:hypothetical protein [Parasporobacterium sp.]